MKQDSHESLTRRSFKSVGPVKHDRHWGPRRRITGGAHEESLTISTDCIAVRKARLHIALEKLSRDAAFKFALGPQVHCHHLLVFRDEEQFLSVPTPQWLPPSTR